MSILYWILLVVYVSVMGVLTLLAHDRWGLPGALALVAASIAIHGLMLRRQKGLENRLTALLENMSDDEVRAELAKMPEDDREEVRSALRKMGRQS